jgi:hypothetical protein
MFDPTTAGRNGDVPDDSADPAQMAAAVVSSAPESAKADAAAAALHALHEVAKADVTAATVQELPDVAKAQVATVAVMHMNDAAKADVASAAMNALPDAAKASVVASAMKDAAEAARSNIATSMIKDLPVSAQAAATAEAVRALPDDAQDEVIQRFTPDQAVTNDIWRWIVKTFALVLGGATVALMAAVVVSFWKEIEPANVQMLLTVFTTTAGILAGFVSGRASTARSPRG